MTAKPLFLFGTLRYAPLLQVVAGADLTAEPAHLPGHRVAHAVGVDGVQQVFPCLAAEAGGDAAGILVRPDAKAQERLDAYERLFDYDPQPVQVLTDNGPQEALVYRPAAGAWQPGDDWSLKAWAQARGTFGTRVAAEIMAILPFTPMASVKARFGMIESHVGSMQRAQAQPMPTQQRRSAQPDDVHIEALRRPYNHFFGVQEADLRFRRFDGTLSDAVTRAGFVMADAVTVLPYDPVRDCVMLVEQFRFGPLIRGEPNPWSLEPIAGRIDAQETPEAAARREAQEEAGLTLTDLILMQGYYVSPGAVSEYLLSYLALVDLSPERAGIGGLETEAEDIRAHILPFDAAMALVQSGEAATAPLLISLMWLQARRASLRGA